MIILNEIFILYPGLHPQYEVHGVLFKFYSGYMEDL